MSEAAPPLSGSEKPKEWKMDISKQWPVWIGCALIIGSVVAAFWFIHEFAVNTVINDQLADLNLIRTAHEGHLTLGSLWSQHNESRTFFPNLVVLLLAYTTHFNIVVEEYVNGILLVLTTGLLIMAHRRRAPMMSWVWYVPVALGFLMFDVLASAIYGFLFCWFLVLAAVAVVIFILDRGALSWFAFSVAIAAAIVGSFSTLQGLFIWLAGLVLLYLRHHRKVLMVIWVVFGALSSVLYFTDYNFAASGGDKSYALHHPGLVLKLFLFTIGDVTGVRAEAAGRPVHGWYLSVTVPGLIILLIAVWAVVHGFRSGRDGSSPVGVALVIFGLIFDASIAIGRPKLGISNAPRYMPFEATVWVGAYLALFDRAFDWSKSARATWPDRIDRALGIQKTQATPIDQPRLAVKSGSRSERIDWVARCVLMALMVLAIASGPHIGLIDARSWHQRGLRVTYLSNRIDSTSDSQIEKSIGNFYSPPVIRQLIRFERSQGLSQFSTVISDAAPATRTQR